MWALPKLPSPLLDHAGYLIVCLTERPTIQVSVLEIAIVFKKDQQIWIYHDCPWTSMSQKRALQSYLEDDQESLHLCQNYEGIVKSSYQFDLCHLSTRETVLSSVLESLVTVAES